MVIWSILLQLQTFERGEEMLTIISSLHASAFGRILWDKNRKKNWSLKRCFLAEILHEFCFSKKKVFLLISNSEFIEKSNASKIHGYFHWMITSAYKLNRLLNTHAFCVFFFYHSVLFVVAIVHTNSFIFRMCDNTYQWIE